MAFSLGKGIYSYVGRCSSGVQGSLANVFKMTYSSTTKDTAVYETLTVQAAKPFVYHVELNRPKKYNSFNHKMWSELANCFDDLSDNPECRVVVLTGSGKHFTAGLDLQNVLEFSQRLAEHEDCARKGKFLRQTINLYQNGISSLERCVKPVISVTHSACVGAGVDLITASDIRYCSSDAWFQVKEVEIGMAADVGTLQRLPKVIGNQSLVREICYTARKVDAKEALECGLVSKVFPDKDSAVNSAMQLAEDIAQKSPLAIQNTKKNLVFSRDHTVQEGLDHIAFINELSLQSEDFVNACVAQATKGDKPVFSKL